MTIEKVRRGTGIISAAFAVVYAAFAAVACVWAFKVCPAEGDGTLSRNAVQLAAVILVIAALSVAAFSICWIVCAAKGWHSKADINFFGWLCINALIMFFVPQSVTYSTVDMFPSAFAFMAFVPVLAPVVLILASAVVMFGIIKEKNGGYIRRIKK